MQHNLEQQIQARNQSGVSEEVLRECSMMFKHFDKDKSGKLEHEEFKSCLRALGYDLPMVEEGETDPQFQVQLNKNKCQGAFVIAIIEIFKNDKETLFFYSF